MTVTWVKVQTTKEPTKTEKSYRMMLNGASVWAGLGKESSDIRPDGWYVAYWIAAKWVEGYPHLLEFREGNKVIAAKDDPFDGNDNGDDDDKQRLTDEERRLIEAAKLMQRVFRLLDLT